MKGHITPGPLAGTWYLRVELPRDANGSRQRRRDTFRGSKKDAEKRLREIIREVECGGSVDAARITFAQLVERWLETTEHRVGTLTFASYRAHVRFYIIPELGALRADAVRPAHVEKALTRWATVARNDGHKGHLSPRSVAHIFNTLRSACKWAVRTGILNRNPVDAVSAPRVERREMRALGLDGIAELVAAARGSELEDPIAVALGTGLRRGELLGLRWPDVDLEKARLSVKRSVETVDGITRTKPPKTARSARTISLPTSVVEILVRRRAIQRERRMMLGLGRDDQGWIFTRADETAWDPAAFSLFFARLVKRSKLQHVRFHDLRHSFGTLALASGVDLKTVSNALGHSAITTTANTYLHAVETLERDAAARIEALIGDALATPARAVGESPATGSGPRRAHGKTLPLGKARGYGHKIIALTGVEPVSQP
jgi:integrase